MKSLSESLPLGIKSISVTNEYEWFLAVLPVALDDEIFAVVFAPVFVLLPFVHTSVLDSSKTSAKYSFARSMPS